MTKFGEVVENLAKLSHFQHGGKLMTKYIEVGRNPSKVLSLSEWSSGPPLPDDGMKIWTSEHVFNHNWETVSNENSN